MKVPFWPWYTWYANHTPQNILVPLILIILYVVEKLDGPLDKNQIYIYNYIHTTLSCVYLFAVNKEW